MSLRFGGAKESGQVNCAAVAKPTMYTRNMRWFNFKEREKAEERYKQRGKSAPS